MSSCRSRAGSPWPTPPTPSRPIVLGAGRTGPGARGAAGRRRSRCRWCSSMPYTEAMFCALALWAAGRAGRGDRWLAAAVLAACAGLVRPTAAAVVLAVWRGRRARLAPREVRRPAGSWPPSAVAPLGMAAYLGLRRPGDDREPLRRGASPSATAGDSPVRLRARSRGRGCAPCSSSVAARWTRCNRRRRCAPRCSPRGGCLRERLAAATPRCTVLAVTGDRPRDERHVGEQVPVPAAGARRHGAVLVAAGMTRWRSSSRIAVLLLWVLTGAWLLRVRRSWATTSRSRPLPTGAEQGRPVPTLLVLSGSPGPPRGCFRSFRAPI